MNAAPGRLWGEILFLLCNYRANAKNHIEICLNLVIRGAWENIAFLKKSVQSRCNNADSKTIESITMGVFVQLLHFDWLREREQRITSLFLIKFLLVVFVQLCQQDSYSSRLVLNVYKHRHL